MKPRLPILKVFTPLTPERRNLKIIIVTRILIIFFKKKGKIFNRDVKKFERHTNKRKQTKKN